MNPSIEFSRKLGAAYDASCKPLCRELGIPQTALDILLFLANNPSYRTAAQIVSIRKLKANLVSVNVNRLVGDGYLERRAVEGDRRQTELVPTEAAQPIIRRGREIQERFCRELLDGMSEERKAQFHETVEIMEGNLDRILGEEWAV